jgi:hypothetical protein
MGRQLPVAARLKSRQASLPGEGFLNLRLSSRGGLGAFVSSVVVFSRISGRTGLLYGRLGFAR